jgi:hypothetical protein
VIRSGEDGVYIMVSKEKWTKAKRLVEEVAEMIVATPMLMDRKRLEQIRGFLIYIVQTYREMTPYLIGLHMTIDFWQPNRDEEGWRVRSASDVLLLHNNQESRREGPKRVRAAPRLASDMEALRELLAGDVPRLKRVRCRTKGQAFYGFGDASGSSFGASFQIGDEIDVEYGQWYTESTEVESSNW